MLINRSLIKKLKFISRKKKKKFCPFLECSQNSQEIICVRLRPATLFKKRLWYWCFPVNFAKILRTPFLIENLWWFWWLFPTFANDYFYLKNENRDLESSEMFSYFICNLEHMIDCYSCSIVVVFIYSEGYLGPYKSSMIGRFCENS